MRLDKIIALTGMSRSDAKNAITRGRVCVKGSVVRSGSVNAEIADVTLDGKPIEDESELYIMLNKPAGVITATEDRSLPTVMDFLPDKYKRRKIGPVGRLDRDVTGLVLMTTDGTLAHRLISPKWKAEKVYRAVCEGELTSEHINAFEQGIELSDFTAAPAKLAILTAGEDSIAEVTLTEGKFHEVKRMFIAIGHPLKSLSRLSIGCVKLDPSLEEGAWRKLTDEEIAGLKNQSGMNGDH